MDNAIETTIFLLIAIIILTAFSLIYFDYNARYIYYDKICSVSRMHTKVIEDAGGLTKTEEDNLINDLADVGIKKEYIVITSNPEVGTTAAYGDPITVIIKYNLHQNMVTTEGNLSFFKKDNVFTIKVPRSYVSKLVTAD